MGLKRRRSYDLAAMVCFAGLVGLPIWFATCALGPKLGLADGWFALETLTFTWGLVLSGIVLAAAVTALGLMVSLRRTEHELPHGSWVAIGALAVSLAAFATCIAGAQVYRSHPPVSEVTTDGANPPDFTEALVLRRGVKANTIEHAGGFRPEAIIEPVRIAAPPGAVFDALIDMARERRWRVGSVARHRGLIELTIESFWYAQTDDIAIRLTELEDGTTRLDYRAAARTGSRDGGRNARRLDRIEADLTGRLN